MRKFFVAILVAFLGFAPAHADKMVNVEYIHKLIEQRWDISIPYSPKLSTPKVAANMKYLLTLVDMTNKRINGVATTHYGDGEFATMAAADTVAANTAITKLARIKPKFTITTTPDTTEFTFQMSASGRFMVDWGDNSATQIVRDKVTGLTPYTHTYKKPGEYKIKMTGRATGYATNGTAAVQFNIFNGNLPPNTTIAKIDGSLGAIFSTIGDGDDPGQQPLFHSTFYRCHGLTGEIPKNLFTGIHGAPVSGMFANTFYGCENMTGEIPPDLFAGLSGAPVENMFASTFLYCKKLTGSIPENLFAGIKGQPAAGMFSGTFWGCTNITGEIPPNLFAGISGQPAPNMFGYTFNGCANLTGEIPPELFAGIKGQPAPGMFGSTFYGCNNLTGSIPANLFKGIKGTPAKNMYNATFFHCGNLTGEIPANLFGEISGAPAEKMYYWTFYSCFNLTGCVPDGLFGDVGMTLDEIIAEYSTFGNMYGVTKKYCSVLEPKFTVTTTADTSEFKFDMSAQGLFKIDWGDGKSQIVNRTNTTNTTYSHEYDAPGEYKIGIGGYATGYNTATNVATISFAGTTDAPNTTVAGIDGSLGAIFGTIDDGSEPGQQPRFYNTFYNCSELAGSIPDDLFGNISGPAKDNMFGSTFYGCAKLSGKSAEINGVPLYNFWPDATTAQVSGCYKGALGLSDYDAIPEVWKTTPEQ